MANYIELPNQNRLSGINTLAYMGTEANTPPQFVIEKRAPTPNDLKNWRIGTIWLKQVLLDPVVIDDPLFTPTPTLYEPSVQSPSALYPAAVF